MTFPKILIVEDESIVAKDLQNRLKRFGYSVTGIVSSGEEAITKTFQACPDLVLMDISLQGDMDGVEAAKQIHSRVDVPIIYLTAYPDTLARANLTKTSGYLIKPFKVRELHNTIETALAKRQTESSRETYLTHPTFGMLYRLCVLEENQELFTTLYAQRFFFLVTTGPTGIKFEPISRNDAGFMVESRLRHLRRQGQSQDYNKLHAMHQQTF